MLSVALPVAFATSLLAVTVTGRECVVERARALKDVQRAAVVKRHTHDIALARSTTSAWSARRRPGVGLVANLTSALQAAGLPPSTLVSATAQPETPVNGLAAETRLLRQQANATLGALTLPQLGAFLETWRTSQPLWIVTAIEVSAEAAAASGSGEDRPLKAVLTLQCMYLDEPIGGDQ